VNIRTIRRVTVGSAFKVGGVISAVFFTVVYVPIVLLEGLGLAILSQSGNNYGGYGSSYSSSNILLSGVIGLGCGWIAGIVIAAITGGISAALYAWIYNITFGMHGGIKTEVIESTSSY